MSRADHDKWEARYRAGAYADRPHPTALLATHVASLPHGRVLDVACGAGRNSLFLASRDFRVDAIDISGTALARVNAGADRHSRRISLFEADLDDGLPPAIAGQRYDLIVFVRYVNMPLLEQVCELVAPGGAILCEEHLETTRAVGGPRGRNHRVRQGELAHALRTLQLRFYREGLVDDPDGRRMSLAQAIATRDGTFELNYC